MRKQDLIIGTTILLTGLRHSINDITVPYVTAAIELQDPFADSDKNGIEM